MKDLPSLRGHQINDLAFYLANPFCGNLSDPGTGKTPTVNVYAEYLWKHKNTKVVFNMPTKLFRQNKESFHKFTNLQDHQVVILRSSLTKKQYEKAINNPEAVVFLASFDFFKPAWRTVKTPDGGKTKKYFPAKFTELREAQEKLGFKNWANFVDEFHLGFKSAKSHRCAYWKATVHNHMQSLIGMTGTLIDGRYDTAYPLIEAIEPRYYPGGYQEFLNIHAIKCPMSGNIVDWQHEDKIIQILERHTVKSSFVDVYGPEAKEIFMESIELSPEQRVLYEGLEEEATIFLERQEQILDGFVEGQSIQKLESGLSSALVELRCRQVMNSPWDVKNNWKGYTPKIESLETYIEPQRARGKPVLIFGTMQTEVEKTCEYLEKVLGYRAAYIHGSVSDRRAEQIDKDFREGRLDVLAATPDTVGVGFNWEMVDLIVFMDMDYKDSAFLQGYRRAMRGVRESPLLIYVLEYADTVERRILRLFDKKTRIANRIDKGREVFDLADRARKSTKITKTSKVHASGEARSGFNLVY